MLNVRLAGYHLYDKLLLTWLSLVMSLMVSFSFIAGRPKVALLFWFFSDIRCCVLLFIIIIVYKYRNRKK